MTPELARALHRLPRAHARRCSCWCSSRTCSAAARAGQPARHHRRASELAAQAAARRCEALAAATSASSRCAELARARLRRRRAPRTALHARRARRSRARPTACSCTATSRFATRRALVPYLADARREPRLLLAVSCARGRAARTATTSSTTTRSTRRSAREPTSSASSADAAARTAWAMLLDIVPNHMGVHGRRQRLVARRARERPGLGATPTSSTSTGTRPTRAWPARCCCRCSATSTARCSSAASCSCTFDARERQLRRALLRAPLPDRSAQLSAPARALRSSAGADACRRAAQLRALAAAFARLPRARRRRRRRARERRARQGRCTGAARAARRDRSALAGAHRRASRRFNGTPRRAASFDALHALLERAGLPPRATGASPPTRSTTGASSTSTIWRRCAWRRADVFEATHRFVLDAGGRRHGRRPAHRPSRRPVRSGSVLPAPAAALSPSCAASPSTPARRRAAAVRRGREDRRAARAPARATGPCTAPPATASPTWSTALFVDAAREARLERAWRAFAGDEADDFDELALALPAHRSCASALAGELTVLATALLRIARADRRTRDFTLNTLRRGARRGGRVLPGLPHLRRRASRAAQDRRYIDWAVGARAPPQPGGRRAASSTSCARVLLGSRARARAARAAPSASARFARRFQQFTAPVTAKGIEDTALLPLQPARLAQRRRRRSRTSSASRVRAFHGASRDRARALAAHDARHLDARQQALRGRARAHRRALARCRPRGACRCAAGAA